MYYTILFYKNEIDKLFVKKQNKLHNHSIYEMYVILVSVYDGGKKNRGVQ